MATPERVTRQKPPLLRGTDKAWQAFSIWSIFIVVAVILNGTIPFAFGADLRDWSSSTTKTILFSLIVYSGLFLVAPLILTKGWRSVRRPAFLAPLCLAVVGFILWGTATRYAAFAVVPVILYLHKRFDLSELGIRSFGLRGDIAGVVLLALLSTLPSLVGDNFFLNPSGALIAGINRFFANPASTVENLFYFGFLTERLSAKTGRWLTPLLIGAMYTFHEMSNPEYWYEGMQFDLVFIGVVVTASVYLWRRSVVVIWLGDGLGKLMAKLF